MTTAGRPHLLAIGGAHVDRRGKVSARFIPGASNPGHMREEVGGGAFNALRIAVQRGVGASLISARGGDSAGERVAKAIEAAGIADLSAVFIDRPSASYTAILDENGDVVAALADMDLYETAFPRQMARRKLRDSIAAADAVLCDANLPAQALEKLASLRAGRPLFALAVSPAKVTRLRTILPSISALFMNRREALALTVASSDSPPTEIVQALRGAGLARGTVSDGGCPLLGFAPDGTFTIAPPETNRIADVTGAGDAVAGGTVAALMRGLDFAAAVREGVAAAHLVLLSPSAVPNLGQSAFEGSLALVPDPAFLA